jgi:DNA-binding transcriptional MocR family regulator
VSSQRGLIARGAAIQCDRVTDTEQSPAARIAGATAREIVASIEAAIERGDLGPGEVLPSVRRLASDLGVSPVTVVAAYRELRQRGVVTTHERRRTRVSARPPIAMRSGVPLSEDIRDLASDNPDPAFLPDIGVALREIETPPHLYGVNPVLPELAELAASEFGSLGLQADHIAVVNGTFDGLERILQARLKPGDPVAVEDPGYTGVLDLVRALGLEPVGVALDERGPLPDALGRALEAGARACVITPRAQNPLGAALDADRAGALRDVLERFPGALVIEDDHAGPVTDLPYHTLVQGRERWAVLRSVSKFLSPDLRLALMCGDNATVSQVLGRQLLASGWVSYVLQRTVVALWRRRETAELLEQAKAAYSARRTATLEALAARGVAAIGVSGLNVWIPVREEATAMRNLMQLGWAVTAGEIFRLASPPGLRVTTAALPVADVERLADDTARVLNPAPRTARA